MKNEEFYIGYLPKAPDQTSKFIRNLLIVLFFIISIAGILLATHQRKFSTAVFEYGSNKEYTGVFSSLPVPSLRIINQRDSSGKIIDLTIPLVGYGKHGAESAIEKYERENGISLEHKMVTLKGDLLYGEGKTLLSLNQETPILHFENSNELPGELIFIHDSTITGEIIDPKCYFGVMKPGKGKVHRECAIRCISGGIPPVFKVRTTSQQNEYFLLRGKNGESINQNVLPFVADRVEIHGKLFRWNDWMVFQIDPGMIQRIN